MQIDFTPYVDIVTDELDLLYWDGVDVVNAATDERFTCHVMLLNIVTDYRGMPELFRTAQAPAYIGACYVCGVEGWRMDGNVSKTCYSGECNCSQSNWTWLTRSCSVHFLTGYSGCTGHRLGQLRQWAAATLHVVVMKAV